MVFAYSCCRCMKVKTGACCPVCSNKICRECFEEIYNKPVFITTTETIEEVPETIIDLDKRKRS